MNVIASTIYICLGLAMLMEVKFFCKMKAARPSIDRWMNFFSLAV
jgi:hypothetical protein